VSIQVRVEARRKDVEPRLDRVESRVQASRQGIDSRAQEKECPERGRSEEPDGRPDRAV
jgi:hypothetical protein